MVNVHRKLVQLVSAIAANSYFQGFLKGKIYQGKIKAFCFPGLNCYSCPGAVGSCPIGSLQAVAAGLKYQFSFYVAGFLILVGTLTGRLVCGWICPFGLLQELLYKIPSKKIRLSKKLNIVKYLILVFFILLLPAIDSNEFGFGVSYFCKYICPAGTLEAGIPLALSNRAIRNALGWLFAWKFALLIVFIIFAVISMRPFCRVVCPLGAIYSLFNPISFYRMNVKSESCTKCNICEKKCPMDLKIYENANSMECIRCGECKKGCPQKAVYGFIAAKQD